jgi:hypothetical protein
LTRFQSKGLVTPTGAEYVVSVLEQTEAGPLIEKVEMEPIVTVKGTLPLLQPVVEFLTVSVPL